MVDLILCSALKEGLRDAQGELGLFLVGGKGKASRKTPMEIVEAGERYGLIQLQRQAIQWPRWTQLPCRTVISYITIFLLLSHRKLGSYPTGNE